jgi:hypothetical protein
MMESHKQSNKEMKVRPRSVSLAPYCIGSTPRITDSLSLYLLFFSSFVSFLPVSAWQFQLDTVFRFVCHLFFMALSFCAAIHPTSGLLLQDLCYLFLSVRHSFIPSLISFTPSCSSHLSQKWSMAAGISFIPSHPFSTSKNLL